MSGLAIHPNIPARLIKKRGGSQNLHKSDQCYKTDPICNRQRNAGAINSLHWASSFKCFIPTSQASRAPD